jgi:hypothetical protein
VMRVPWESWHLAEVRVWEHPVCPQVSKLVQTGQIHRCLNYDFKELNRLTCVL